MMAGIGAALLLLATVCNQWLPINKKLWTSSFAIFMAGLDFVLLAGFAWLVDDVGWQKPVRPLVILGMNSIAIYMLSEMLDVILSVLNLREPIYQNVFAPLASPINASLLYAIAYVLVNYLAAYVLYRNKWFIKI